MNVSLEKTDDVTGKLTVKLEKADYADNVEKALKNLRQKANMPGFRPGMVPMGMIKKMYGNEVKAEEINKTLSAAVNNYIKEQKLQLLADPLISENQKELDIVGAEEFEFAFDLGLAPQVAVELTDKDEIPYYDIQVDDKTVDSQVENYRRQGGKNIEADVYDGDNDLLRGTLVELSDDGSEKADGLKVEKASLMPKFFSNDEQKALFKDAKKNEDIVFNVSKAYDGKESEVASLLKIQKEDVANHAGNFKFNIAEISRFQMAEINQDLFDFVFGKDTIKSEEEFRNRIKSDIETAYSHDSDYKFLMDLRDYADKKAGEIKFPEEILKRFLLNNAKKEEDKKNIDDILKRYISELRWNLVRTRLADNAKVKIDDKAVKDTAREIVQIQFAQYGINSVPTETLDKYADEMLKDENQQDNIISRSIDKAITEAYKSIVKLEHKKVSIEEFNKMFEPENA